MDAMPRERPGEAADRAGAADDAEDGGAIFAHRRTIAVVGEPALERLEVGRYDVRALQRTLASRSERAARSIAANGSTSSAPTQLTKTNAR